MSYTCSATVHSPTKATLADHLPSHQLAAWNCAYYVLLAHAAAVGEFRSSAAGQGGRISMNINMEWGEPWSSDPADKASHGFAQK